MEQSHSIELDYPEPRRRRRPVLWVMRSLFAASCVMMALIILSDPRISARFLGGADSKLASVDAAVAPPVPVETEQILAPQARQAPVVPKVSAMPLDRVPVRRGGFGADD